MGAAGPCKGSVIDPCPHCGESHGASPGVVTVEDLDAPLMDDATVERVAAIQNRVLRATGNRIPGYLIVTEAVDIGLSAIEHSLYKADKRRAKKARKRAKR